MKLLWVAPVSGKDDDEKEKNIKLDIAKIEASLNLNVADGTKIIRLDLTAREFMLKRLLVDELANYFPQDEDLLPEVKLEQVETAGAAEAAGAAEPVEEPTNP